MNAIVITLSAVWVVIMIICWVLDYRIAQAKKKYKEVSANTLHLLRKSITIYSNELRKVSTDLVISEAKDKSNILAFIAIKELIRRKIPIDQLK